MASGATGGSEWLVCLTGWPVGDVACLPHMSETSTGCVLFPKHHQPEWGNHATVPSRAHDVASAELLDYTLRHAMDNGDLGS